MRAPVPLTDICRRVEADPEASYPATLQLLKVLRLLLLELDHMVSHNPECLCDEDCLEEARELLNRHEGLEGVDGS